MKADVQGFRFKDNRNIDLMPQYILELLIDIKVYLNVMPVNFIVQILILYTIEYIKDIQVY
jgi:hypothetical protein